jgi:hypothetical protein
MYSLIRTTKESAMKKIIVEVKSVYGNEAIYPVCDDAKLFASLAGTKTLTRPALEIIKKLGYAVEVKAVEL